MKRQNVVKEHTEKIVCPHCGLGQEAKVIHTAPETKIHSCRKCKYMIMEREWKLVQL